MNLSVPQYYQMIMEQTLCAPKFSETSGCFSSKTRSTNVNLLPLVSHNDVIRKSCYNTKEHKCSNECKMNFQHKLIKLPSNICALVIIFISITNFFMPKINIVSLPTVKFLAASMICLYTIMSGCKKVNVL